MASQAPIPFEQRARPSPPVRLVLVDADPVSQASVEKALTATLPAWIVETYNDPALALDNVVHRPPHLLLIDPGDFGLPALNFLHRVRLQLPQLPVVVWSHRTDEASVVTAFLAGADAFWKKPLIEACLLALVSGALQGDMVSDADAQRGLVQFLHRCGANRLSSSQPVTTREQQVLVELSAWRSNKEISAILGISSGTVHRHVTDLFRKLGVHSRGQAMEQYLNTFSHLPKP